MSAGRGRGRGTGPRMGGPMANNQAALAELRELVPTKPQERFPPMQVPPLKKLTEDEKLEVKFYKEMQHLFVESACFITTEAQRANLTEEDGVERFGDRYKPKRRQAQTLADLHVDLKFFPEELHGVLQPAGGPRKKRKHEKIDILRYIDMTVEADEEGGDEEIASEKEAEEGEDAEDEDKEFSEDGGNDYEQEYFSDGAEDHDDMGDGEEAY